MEEESLKAKFNTKFVIFMHNQDLRDFNSREYHWSDIAQGIKSIN